VAVGENNLAVELGQPAWRMHIKGHAAQLPPQPHNNNTPMNFT
jgi:hypothetical protein